LGVIFRAIDKTPLSHFSVRGKHFHDLAPGRALLGVAHRFVGLISEQPVPPTRKTLGAEPFGYGENFNQTTWRG
jgi:hypothetical protein